MEIVGRTDRGRLRERNEDSVAVDTALGVAVVADGMGGLHHGHLASQEAVAAVLDYLRKAKSPVDDAALEAALAVANERVWASSRVAASVMGTTAVVLAMDHGLGRIAHVGDSRAYLYHDGRLRQLTRDHSMVQEMVDRGLIGAETARRSPSRNVITRALGLEAAFEPDVAEVALAPGDLVLLCSDGLWDMLEDGRIAALLAPAAAGRQPLARCADVLVEAANEAGGLDNITVALARAS